MKKIFAIFATNKHSGQVVRIAYVRMNDDMKTIARMKPLVESGTKAIYHSHTSLTLKEVKAIPDFIMIYDFDASCELLLQRKITRKEAVKTFEKV